MTTAMLIDDMIMPVNTAGNETDMIEHIRLSNETDAEQLYKMAKFRLLNISNWSTIANAPAREFELTDKNGNPVQREAQCGDKLKIDLSEESLFGGYNHWVEIVDIDEEVDPFEDIAVIAITVKAIADPNGSQDFDMADDNSTNTFLVRRIGQVVSAEIHGRNETPKGNRFLGAIRHFVGRVARKLGFPISEWKHLAAGLLGTKQNSYS